MAWSVIDYSAAGFKIVEWHVGNTFDFVFDFVPHGSFDFTGASGKCRLVKKSDNTTVADLTTQITFPTANEIQITVGDAVTALWPICDLLGDVEITFQDTTIRTMLKLWIIPQKPITPP